MQRYRRTTYDYTVETKKDSPFRDMIIITIRMINKTGMMKFAGARNLMIMGVIRKMNQNVTAFLISLMEGLSRKKPASATVSSAVFPIVSSTVSNRLSRTTLSFGAETTSDRQSPRFDHRLPPGHYSKNLCRAIFHHSGIIIDLAEVIQTRFIQLIQLA